MPSKFGFAEVGLRADVKRIKDERGVSDDVDLGATPRLGPCVSRIHKKQPQDFLTALICLLIENVSAMDRQLGDRRGVRRRMIAVDVYDDIGDVDRLTFDDMQLRFYQLVLPRDPGREVVGD